MAASAVAVVREPGPAGILLDFTASRSLGRGVDVFFGVQNLLDEEFYVQTNPTTIGAPRQLQGGIRVRFAGR
jgi:outer membrane receptor protein involved in Fe transport